MPAGLIALLHASVGLGAWELEPGVLAPIVASAVLYGYGVRTLWRNGAGRGVRRWEVGAFAAGMVTLALALLSPLHQASEELFTAHMIQHELLMVLAAPLLVLGRPAVVMLWAFPARGRARVAEAIRSRSWRAAWSALSRPFDAWLIHGVAIWCWHLPVLFQATLRSELVHSAQHLSFVGSALLFWWAIIHPPRRSALGLSILYLFTTAVHTAVLGALMTFARSPWYPSYASSAAAWGLSPIEDQQLAGLVMWVPASFAYLVAALLVLRRWLTSSDWSLAREERATAAA